MTQSDRFKEVKIFLNISAHGVMHLACATILRIFCDVVSPIRTGIGFSLKTKKLSQAVALHNTISNMKWELGFLSYKSEILWFNNCISRPISICSLSYNCSNKV